MNETKTALEVIKYPTKDTFCFPWWNVYQYYGITFIVGIILHYVWTCHSLSNISRASFLDKIPKFIQRLKTQYIAKVTSIIIMETKMPQYIASDIVNNYIDQNPDGMTKDGYIGLKITEKYNNYKLKYKYIHNILSGILMIYIILWCIAQIVCIICIITEIGIWFKNNTLDELSHWERFVGFAIQFSLYHPITKFTIFPSIICIEMCYVQLKDASNNGTKYTMKYNNIFSIKDNKLNNVYMFGIQSLVFIFFLISMLWFFIFLFPSIFVYFPVFIIVTFVILIWGMIAYISVKYIFNKCSLYLPVYFGYHSLALMYIFIVYGYLNILIMSTAAVYSGYFWWKSVVYVATSQYCPSYTFNATNNWRLQFLRFCWYVF